MRLLPSLLRRVYRALNPDPDAFVAMRLEHPEGGTWHIRDAELTLQAFGTVTPPPDIIPLAPDTGPITVRQLAAIIEAAGWTVSDLDITRAGRGAIALIETETPSGSPALLAHDSLLWALFDAYALELDAAAAAAASAPNQLAPPTADGFWLDELGRYYGVPRLPDEADGLYAPRLVEEVLRPKSNNLAMAAIIEALTGQPTTVTDVTNYGDPFPSYDGAIVHDGTYTHSATARAIHGLFDVETRFDLLGAGDIAAFTAAIVAQIERLRAAGTLLRNISITGGDIAEPAPGIVAEAIADTSAAFADTDAAPPAADAELSQSATAEITDDAADPADAGPDHDVATDILDAGPVADDAEQIAAGDLDDFAEAAIGPDTEAIADTEGSLDSSDAAATPDEGAEVAGEIDDFPDPAGGPSAEAMEDTEGSIVADDAVTAPADDIDSTSGSTSISDAVDAAVEAAELALSHDLVLDGSWTLAGTRSLASGLTLTESL